MYSSFALPSPLLPDLPDPPPPPYGRFPVLKIVKVLQSGTTPHPTPWPPKTRQYQDVSQADPACSLGEAGVLLLHQMYDLVVHTVRGVQAPDEIHMCPFRNVLMVDEIRHLGEQRLHVLWIWKPVLTPGPHCSGDRHVSDFVPYGSWLEKKEWFFSYR